VAPERAADTETFFKVSMEDLTRAIFIKGDKAKEELSKLKELRNQYNDLFVFLEISGAQLAAKSSQDEYERMREYARVILQYVDSLSRSGFAMVAARDLYMADNFRRIVTREPAGTRFVLWAHNGHIMANNSRPTYLPFGYHLRSFYGKEYYALGFSFNQGSFQSRELQPKDPTKRMLMSFTVHPAPTDSIHWYLAQRR